jgi:hypothetical protein
MCLLCIHNILFQSFVRVFLELWLSVLVHHKQSPIIWCRPTDYVLVCSWRDFKLYLTFWGPCIVIYSYNRSQQDTLFLNFILIYNSTCFGQTYCPSSGVWILYSQQLVFVIPACWLSASDSQHKLYDKYQLLWIQYHDSWWWTVSLSETCRGVYQNKVEK